MTEKNEGPAERANAPTGPYFNAASENDDPNLAHRAEVANASLDDEFASPLQPDRGELAKFTRVLFKNCDPAGLLAIRSFSHQKGARPKVQGWLTLGGSGTSARTAAGEAIVRSAREAAESTEPLVFCPPVATFKTAGDASEANILEGPTLAVDLDAKPLEGLAKLRTILGEPTLIVETGGQWTDPKTGEIEAKLHVHWKLGTPARGEERLAALYEARELAAVLVGGDGTAKAVSHPLRWAGSVHRKGTPCLARIGGGDEDRDIDLDDALAALRAALLAADDARKPGRPAPAAERQVGAGPPSPDDIADAVRQLPNNLNWDDWNERGLAIHAATNGTGFEIFDEFSRRSPKYDRAETEARWKHYHRHPARALGAGTLFHLANQANPNWRKPSDGPRGGDSFFRPGARVAHPDDGPQPLRRAVPPPEPFPLDALGPVLADAARAIAAKVQCPDAIGGQAVLAAASLAVQAHADVVHPATGQAKPLSLFLVTVAASGERKTAADCEAMRAVKARERDLVEAHKAEMAEYRDAMAAWDDARAACLKNIKKESKGKTGRAERQMALAEIGEKPRKPRLPFLTAQEPTLEGLHKLYDAPGWPSLGLFNDEAGSFVGGHGMTSENRLRTAAGLSVLWDGSDIKRVRSGDGATMLLGRRLAAHLMIQPEAAAGLLSDPVLKDQGLLSRLLVAAPQTAAGTRFIDLNRPHSPGSDAAILRFERTLAAALAATPDVDELKPRCVTLDEEAKEEWTAFANYCEMHLAPEGVLEPVRGFASKLAEHALRIAGVQALVADLGASHICADAMSRGIELARYYAAEALRLFGAGTASPEIAVAQRLLDWLKGQPDEFISVKLVTRYGPNLIREAKAARASIKTLEEHNWLAPSQRQIVRGEAANTTWRVVREAAE